MKKSKTALMKATDFLAIQDQSTKNLRKKLLACKYDIAEINDAIAKLEKYNYLNDERNCQRQFENMYEDEKMSVKQICVKLFHRGYSLDLIEKFIPDDIYEHEFKVANNLVQKKYRSQNFENDAEIYQFKKKIWQYLMAKGFDNEIINDVIENYLSNIDTNNIEF